MDADFLMSLVSFLWSVFQITERLIEKVGKKKTPQIRKKKKRKSKKRR